MPRCQVAHATALLASLVLSPLIWASGAGAHDGVDHATRAEAAAHAEPAAPLPAGALPFPVEIRPRFALTDQTGREVTEADFSGRPWVLFFGYANCDSICTVALPAMAAALDLLGPGEKVEAVMITVDPARDTVAALAEAIQKHHPGLTGLTGSEAALAEARAGVQVEVAQVATDAAGGAVYAHGSFIYLVGPDGRVASLLPPITAPERIADLIRRQLAGS